MALLASDLKLYLTGGASNADPDLSLGGVTSSVQFIDNTLGNLFSNVTPAEAIAGSVKYRALAFKNTGAQTAYDSVMYISLETVSTFTTVAIAYDSTGTQTIVNEDTAPIGLSFTTPITLATGIALGDIAAGAQKRVWFRRTVTAGATILADSGSITFTIGTAP